MKLWLIERDADDDIGWDEFRGFVIAAEDEEAARKCAMERPGDEGADVWKKATCQLIGEANERVSAGVVLSDFNAG